VNAAEIQALIFVGADGAAKLFPVAAPFVAVAEGLIKGLEAAGVISLPVPPAQIEQMRQLVAGMAAAQASAVTTALEHQRAALPRICPSCIEALAGHLATTGASKP